MTAREIDARDPIGHPHVCEELPLHHLELVELLDRHVAVDDGERPLLGERVRVEEAKDARAVAEDQRPVRMREAPALPSVRVLGDRLERVRVVHEAAARPIRELVDAIAEHREPFSEELGGEGMELKDPPALEVRHT